MAQKFLFETEFVVEETVAEEVATVADAEQAPPEPTYNKAELERARSDGVAEGHAAGLGEARAEIASFTAQATERLSEQLSIIANTVLTHRDSVIHEATAVTSAIIRKVAPELIRRGALDSIEAAIAGCLPNLAEEPRIVVRVCNDVLDEIQARIGPIVDASGFTGDVVIIPDAALEASDCTVEWADGGIRLDPSRVWRDIDEILRKHLEIPELVASQPDQEPILSQTTPEPDVAPDPGELKLGDQHG